MKEILQDMINHDVTLTSSSWPPPAPDDSQLHMISQSNMDDLPDEIIELILLSKYCPVKSVISFKSVSKLWQSIISDARFLRSLQSRLSEDQNHEHKFFICAPAKERYWDINLMIVEDGKFRRESAAPFTSDHCGKPICSCNGLILLRGQSYNEYVLWNPLIRKHIIIRPLDMDIRNHFIWRQHLYYDSDYKIVFVYGHWYKVYSCQSGSWGERKYFPSDCNLYLMMRQGEFVDGCLYTVHSGEIICCFDFRDGKTHNLPRPKGMEGLFEYVKAVSGRLCLYCYTGDDEERLQLWVMEKKMNKCWRKLMSIEIEESLLECFLHPVCLTNQDDVVLRYDISAGVKHFLYNPSRNTCNLQELAWDYDFDHCFPYSENLLMPTSTSNTPS